MNTNQENDRAKDQAKAQFDSIREMVKALRDAQDTNDDGAIDDARLAIEEDPLSVQVRSGWHSPGEKAESEEFEILLCTGGTSRTGDRDAQRLQRAGNGTDRVSGLGNSLDGIPIGNRGRKRRFDLCRGILLRRIKQSRGADSPLMPDPATRPDKKGKACTKKGIKL